MKRNFLRAVGVLALGLSTLVVSPVSAAAPSLKWHPATRIAPALGSMRAVACTTDTCFSATQSGLLQSSNHSAWTRSTAPLVATASLAEISCDTAGTTCEAATVTGDVVTTTNDGASWSKGPSLSKLIGKGYFNGMTCVANAFCLAHFGPWSGKESFARATLSGASVGAWTLITTPLIVSAGEIVCPTTTNCLVGGSSTTSFSSPSEVLYSTNAGLTWVKSAGASVSRGYADVACAADGSALCLAAGQGQLTQLSSSFGFLYRSTDYGVTWSKVTLASDVTDFNTPVCISATNCVADKVTTSGTGFSASSTDYEVQSTDGGVTWNTAPSLPTSRSSWTFACVAGHGCFYATSTGPTQVFFSTNFASWSAMTFPTSSTDVSGISCASSTTCFTVSYPLGRGTAASPAQFFASSNGGSSWTYRSTLPDWFGTFSSLSCPTTTTCVGTGDKGNGDLFILRTTDAGTTWNNVDLGSLDPAMAQLSSLQCAGTHCVAVGATIGVNDNTAGLILDSTDGGATWSNKSITLDGALNDLSCPTPTSCVAVGFANGTGFSTQPVVFGTNDGSNWTLRSQGTLGGAFTNVSCASSSSCTYGGVDGNFKQILAYSTSGVTFTSKSYATSYLTYLECNGTLCVASYLNNSYKPNYLVSTNSGKTFAVQTVTDKSLTNDYIRQVTCPTSTFCLGATGHGQFTKLSN